MYMFQACKPKFFEGKGTHSTKIALIIWPKILQMPQNLSAQCVCPSLKVWDIIEKMFHRASIVRDFNRCTRLGKILSKVVFVMLQQYSLVKDNFFKEINFLKWTHIASPTH